MEVIVRGTDSIAAYKAERQELQQTADSYSRKHWPESTPVRCWRGADDAVWVEYDSGQVDVCR